MFNDKASSKFLDSAIHEHNANNDILNKQWGFDNYSEWGLDQDSGSFFIQLPNGKMVEAQGQIYGSFSSQDNTWEWAWNNPMVEEFMAKDSLKIKEYGEYENLDFLSEPIIELPDQNTATYLGAIGEKINNAQGHEWKELGTIDTKAGSGNLSQVHTVTEWGKVKMMHVILPHEGKIYVLTASALQEEFADFYDTFFTAMESLHINSEGS